MWRWILNFIEQEIVRYDRRVRKIEQNPSSTMLRANKMLYELERDTRIHQLDAWREGRPMADGTMLSGLLRSLGFVPLDYEFAADRTMIIPEPGRYLDAGRSMGLPDWACDRTEVLVTMATTGDYPPPNFFVVSNDICTPLQVAYNSLVTWYDIPFATLDVELKPQQGSLKYLADQFGEAIEIAESKVPGIKYDEDRHMELMEKDRFALTCLRDIYQLAKRVPCPLSGRDVFRLPRLPSYLCDPDKGVEFYKIYRDEVSERAEKGIGAVAEEKLRLMWAVSGPYYSDPFEILAKRGVSIPVFHIGISPRIAGLFPIYGDERDFGEKPTNPLEEEARLLNYNAFAGLGNSRWIESIIWISRDLKLDGIVHFNQVGCTACTPLAKIVADRAEEELGIPTLLIEGRHLNTEGFDQADFNRRLEEFVDICLDNKDRKRFHQESANRKNETRGGDA